MAKNKQPETMSDQDKEIQEILTKLDSVRKIDDLSDIDFLLSNLKFLGYNSNPQFANAIDSAKKKD